jgi:thiamine pyrophosphokinase
MSQRALIFLNGELKDHEWMRTWIEAGDFLVAVDGGLHHLRSLGIAPQLLIGDLDSVDSHDLEWIKSKEIEILKFPQEKDETDFELALKVAVERGFTIIRVIAALGGRFDQALGNLFLLGSAEITGCDVTLDDGSQEIFLIKKHTEISGAKGDVVSLLPYGQIVSGVRTFGLKYPLHRETLYPDRTRGISNEMIDNNASVDLEGGVLICIHIRSGRED